MKYKCIIFDCDGILVDSEEIAHTVFIQMAKSIGAEISMDYAVNEFAGKSLKYIFETIQELGNKTLPADWEKQYRKLTFDAFKTDLEPIKGIESVLAKLTVPFCVASSGPTNKIRLNLGLTNMLEQFENKIYSSYEIGSWKPNPEIFEYAAKGMGFLPEECAVIEDSLAGIQAARAGGFEVFAYANQSNKTLFEKEGAKVFFDMKDLLSLLEQE